MPYGPLFSNGEAGGTILPRRFVKVDTTADFQFVQSAAATDITIGVTDQRTKAHDSANHAESGDAVHLQDGRHVLEVEAGAAIANGDRLISDANGRAIPSAANTDFVVGIAVETAGAAAEIVRFQWMPYKQDMV